MRLEAEKAARKVREHLRYLSRRDPDVVPAREAMEQRWEAILSWARQQRNGFRPTALGARFEQEYYPAYATKKSKGIRMLWRDIKYLHDTGLILRIRPGYYVVPEHKDRVDQSEW